MSLPQFDVRLRPEGVEVSVNGQAVPGVTGVRIEAADGIIPRLLLQVTGEVTVDGVGVAEATGDDRRELDELLASIDPKVLDRQVLEGAGLGDDGPPGAAYIDAIRRFVRGD